MKFFRSKPTPNHSNEQQLQRQNPLNKEIVESFARAFKYVEEKASAGILDGVYQKSRKIEPGELKKCELLLLCGKRDTSFDFENRWILPEAIKEVLKTFPSFIPSCFYSCSAKMYDVTYIQELFRSYDWEDNSKALFILLLQHLANISNKNIKDEELSKAFCDIIFRSPENNLKISESMRRSRQKSLLVMMRNIKKLVKECCSDDTICCNRGNIRKKDETLEKKEVSKPNLTSKSIKLHGIEVLGQDEITFRAISYDVIYSSFHPFGKIKNIQIQKDKAVVIYDDESDVKKVISEYNGPLIVRSFYFESIPAIISNKMQCEESNEIKNIEKLRDTGFDSPNSNESLQSGKIKDEYMFAGNILLDVNRNIIHILKNPSFSFVNDIASYENAINQSNKRIKEANSIIEVSKKCLHRCKEMYTETSR